MRRLFCLVCIFGLIGCCGNTQTPEQTESWKRHLPPGSTDIEELNSGWVKFKWNNKTYLYQLAGTHGGHSAMVEIRE